MRTTNVLLTLTAAAMVLTAPASWAQGGRPGGAPGGAPGGRAGAPGGAPGGRGGFQMPPEVQAKMDAWTKWFGSHKNISATQVTLGSLSTLQEDPRTSITKAEATKILPILKTWRTKPVMTDAQAAGVNKSLIAPLSAEQKKVVTDAVTAAASRPASLFGGGRRGGRRGGGGAGGAGGRGGAGGAGGGARATAAGGAPGAGRMAQGGGAPGARGGQGGRGGAGGAGGGRRGFDAASIPSPKDFNPLNPDTLPLEMMRPRAKERLDTLVAQLQAAK